MVYVNRSRERREVTNFLDSNNQCILINAKPRLGVTSFLDKIIEDNDNLNRMFLYHHFNSEDNQIAQYLIKNILDYTGNLQLHNEWIQLANIIKKGEVEKTLINSLLEDSSHFGNFINSIYNISKNKGTYCLLKEADPYNAYLKHLWSELESIDFIIVIDSLHFLNDYDFKLFLKMINNYRNVKLISFVESENALKYKHIVEEIIKSTPIVIEFNCIDYKMVKLMRDELNPNIHEDELEQIYKKHANDIHLIVDSLLHPNKQQENKLEHVIQLYLNDLLFPIKKKDLNCIVNWEYLYSSAEYETALNNLESRDKIVIKEGTISLNWSFDNKGNKIQEFRRLSKIINYFKNDSSLDSKQLRRLISLSKIVYPNDPAYVERFYRKLGVYEIQENTLSMSPYEISIAFSRNEYEDIKYRMVAYFILYTFDEAFNYAKPLEDKIKQYDELLLLWGITLNRTRKLANAECILDLLIERTENLNIKCIAVSFQIINKIYLNDMPGAKTIYNNHKIEMKQSNYYHYFIRNSISVISHDTNDGIKKLKEQLKQGICDHFLEGSIHNNLGRAYLTKNSDEAKKSFDLALNCMENYHPCHSVIINNNLAIYYFLEEDTPTALDYISFAESQSMEFMQKCFIQLNKYIFMYKCNPDEALAYMDELEKLVIPYHVKHLKEVYYSTRCLMEAFKGNDNRLSEYLDNLKENYDIFRPHKTKLNIKIYESIIDGKRCINKHLWKELYTPIYLVYWYINPLNLLDY